MIFSVDFDIPKKYINKESRVIAVATSKYAFSFFLLCEGVLVMILNKERKWEKIKNNKIKESK